MSASSKKTHKRFILLFCATSAVLGGCVVTPVKTSPVNTVTARITPYISQTPTPTTSSIPIARSTATHIPTPTLTPQVYTVVRGDTLLGIALRFRVSLEELLDANPDINPTIISIGTKVIIPYIQRTPTVTPEPTPLPISLDDPICYSVASMGLWCFILAHHDLHLTIENIYVSVNLFSRDGKLLAEGIAWLPVDLLYPGTAIPLVYFYPDVIAEDFVLQTELIDALPAADISKRYLDPFIETFDVEIVANGSMAKVTGIVGLPKVSLPARSFSILAVAYGQSGQVVGYRESELRTPFAQGTTRHFELTVFSLGPAIKSVEIFAEARP